MRRSFKRYFFLLPKVLFPSLCVFYFDKMLSDVHFILK